jgi:hypothetical protein
MLEPYNAGIELRTLENRPSAGLDIRANAVIATLTTTLHTERGSSQTTVDMFDPADIHELAGALLAAAERMVAMRVATGAPV